MEVGLAAATLSCIRVAYRTALLAVTEQKFFLFNIFKTLNLKIKKKLKLFLLANCVLFNPLHLLVNILTNDNFINYIL